MSVHKNVIQSKSMGHFNGGGSGPGGYVQYNKHAKNRGNFNHGQ